MKVVTYQSPTGARTDVCQACEARLSLHGWPTDSRGQEYAQAFYGLHEGQCDHCGGDGGLIEWRNRHNLSRAELARRLPVAYRTLEDWEAGKATPPDYLYRALRDLEREEIPE